MSKSKGILAKNLIPPWIRCSDAEKVELLRCTLSRALSKQIKSITSSKVKDNSFFLEDADLIDEIETTSSTKLEYYQIHDNEKNGIRLHFCRKITPDEILTVTYTRRTGYLRTLDSFIWLSDEEVKKIKEKFVEQAKTQHNI